MGCRNFNNVQEKGHRSAVVLKMDGQSYKSPVVGGTPGICSKAQMSFVFLDYGECFITEYILKDSPEASFRSFL